jgi:Pathogenicity locus
MRAKRERCTGVSELEKVPGIGPSIARDLERIGITEIRQLKTQSPQQLYDDLCAVDRIAHDRCLLYVFRCAVYYASHRRHDPEKLKWWNWKDTPVPQPASRRRETG